jgi:hypothetical protein
VPRLIILVGPPGCGPACRAGVGRMTGNGRAYPIYWILPLPVQHCSVSLSYFAVISLKLLNLAFQPVAS